MLARLNDALDPPESDGARADLHVHSDRSDGTVTPAEVIATAKRRGLRAVALTDHDTLAGIEEAASAAKTHDIDFVPGIEFSCYDEMGSTHLLGYYVDPLHAELRDYLAEARRRRRQRAERIVERLNQLGVELTLEAVLAETSPGGLVARPHVARALRAGGWVKSYNEAFDRFLAAGRPAFVPTWRLSPAEGIRWIQSAGGVVVLAHGGKTHDDETIRRFVREGLQGLETLHPEHGPADIRRLRRLAGELGLLETGGSDWHGHADNRRGRLATLPVPYEWVFRLREAAVGSSGRAHSRASVKGDGRA